jgi:hypothetical protein
MTAGHSRRFSGASDMGQTAWAYDHGAHTTRRVGLVDAAHTRADGFRSSSATMAYRDPNQLVFGTSKRYLGAADGGQSVWWYNRAADTTVRIGLVGAGYTRADGYQNADTYYTLALEGKGQIFGSSQRFAGAADRGFAAWKHDTTTGTATQIGLTGAEFTRNDGYQANSVSWVNVHGHAIGHANRYNGGASDIGESAWYYDPVSGQTHDISLTGSTYTNSASGERYTNVYEINAKGIVIGDATRYNGSDWAGQSAMIYDSNTNTTYGLDFSIDPTSGYAYSEVQFLSASGAVFGTYEKFDALGDFLGERAFYWSAATGATDLGNVVNGLSANGWDYLEVAWGENANGVVDGSGYLLNPAFNFTDFVLVPAAVPEPATLALTGGAAAAGVGGVFWSRRRRKLGEALAAEALAADKEHQTAA